MSTHKDDLYTEKGNFTPSPRLDQREYEIALTRFVRYSNDIIILNTDGHFLFPKRKNNKSASGTWFLGGQIPAFTRTEDSLIDTMYRETGIIVEPDRFTFLKQIRIWFNGEEENGFKHDALSNIYTITLSDEEIMSIILDEHEYEKNSLQAYTREDLQKLPEGLFKEIMLDLE